jgi:3-hydroxypropanoate dehydrogenase
MIMKLDEAALDTLFRTARSYNGYLDKPVPESVFSEIWELMRWGPTSANQLPARLVWCDSDYAKQKLANCASSNNRQKILEAPVTVIIAMDSNFHEYLPEFFPHANARSWFANDTALRETSAFRNSTLQGAYFLLAARALGYDTGPMSGFDNDAVDAIFFADQPNIRSNFLSTLGYGDPATVFERLPRPDFDRFNRKV